MLSADADAKLCLFKTWMMLRSGINFKRESNQKNYKVYKKLHLA